MPIAHAAVEGIRALRVHEPLVISSRRPADGVVHINENVRHCIMPSRLELTLGAHRRVNCSSTDRTTPMAMIPTPTAQTAHIRGQHTRRGQTDVSTSRDSPMVAPHPESPSLVATKRNHVEKRPTAKRACIIEPRGHLASTSRNCIRAQRAELRRLHDLTRGALCVVLR